MTAEGELITAILKLALVDAKKKRKPGSRERCATCFLSKYLLNGKDEWTTTMREYLGTHFNLIKIKEWAEKYGIHTCGTHRFPDPGEEK